MGYTVMKKPMKPILQILEKYVFLFMRKIQGNFLMVFELVLNKCRTPSSVTDQQGKGRRI